MTYRMMITCILLLPLPCYHQSPLFPVMRHSDGCDNNIDKKVRRYQRYDKSTISLNYFHMCALKNRIDVLSLNDACILALLVMPSLDDDLQLLLL